MADPLMLRLRREDFLKLAELQDKFIDCIYSFDSTLILHGGTAIWRCYSGNRFSYDIDGYITSKGESDLINEELTWAVSRSGMRLNKIRQMGMAIFAYISDQETELKVELTPMKKKLNPIRKGYERADGSSLSILTFSPEDFIKEKITTYNSRRYIRDLYDIYQLIDKVEDVKIVRAKLKSFLRNLEKPLNEPELGNIILSGVTPTFDDMVKHISGAIK
jgi:predicted nucleotidyltransferase component of viral defense system